MYDQLVSRVTIKTVSETPTEGIFEVEGLYTGYGLTVGNALRRALLSSLPGGAITQIKIKGVGHEFSTLPDVTEDMVEITLNLKKIRFRMHSKEPQVLTLKFKGEGAVTGKDIQANSEVEVITPEAHIATLTAKNAELDIELTVEKGLGYVPLEARKIEKLPIGVIALDAIFTPVTKVNFTVENMRVEDRTDFNRLRFVVETDGSITPSTAMAKGAHILEDHFKVVREMPRTEVQSATTSTPVAEVKKPRVKKTSKK